MAVHTCTHSSGSHLRNDVLFRKLYLKNLLHTERKVWTTKPLLHHEQACAILGKTRKSLWSYMKKILQT